MGGLRYECIWMKEGGSVCEWTWGFVSVCRTCPSFLQSISTPHHTTPTPRTPRPAGRVRQPVLEVVEGVAALVDQAEGQVGDLSCAGGKGKTDVCVCMCVCMQIYVDNPDLLLVRDRHEEAVLEVALRHQWRREAVIKWVHVCRSILFFHHKAFP